MFRLYGIYVKSYCAIPFPNPAKICHPNFLSYTWFALPIHNDLMKLSGFIAYVTSYKLYTV